MFRKVVLTFVAALAVTAAAAPPSSSDGLTSDTSSQASLASTSVALPSSSSISNATGDATDEAFVAALSGRATYYTPNNNYGACGKRIKNSEHTVALSSDNLYLRLLNVVRPLPDNGKKVVATVRYLCPGCATNSLDLTPSAFKKLAKLGKGKIAVKWKFS
ncbi:hypothetical protein EV714DRAFT_271867 [Schizophyllum commune]